jgi:hypothetical protein
MCMVAAYKQMDGQLINSMLRGLPQDPVLLTRSRKYVLLRYVITAITSNPKASHFGSNHHNLFV